jgi:hypothetical protein
MTVQLTVKRSKMRAVLRDCEGKGSKLITEVSGPVRGPLASLLRSDGKVAVEDEGEETGDTRGLGGIGDGSFHRYRRVSRH